MFFSSVRLLDERLNIFAIVTVFQYVQFASGGVLRPLSG